MAKEGEFSIQERLTGYEGGGRLTVAVWLEYDGECMGIFRGFWVQTLLK